MLLENWQTYPLQEGTLTGHLFTTLLCHVLIQEESYSICPDMASQLRI